MASSNCQTVRPDWFFYILPFTAQSENLPKWKHFVPKGVQTFAKYQINLKNIATGFYIFAKVAKIRHIWSRCYQTCSAVSWTKKYTKYCHERLIFKVKIIPFLCDTAGNSPVVVRVTITYSLDSTKQVNLLLIFSKQICWIQISPTGDLDPISFTNF